LGRNAIQASQKDQTVLFSATCEQQRIQLIVQDEGAGIDPEILPLIFEPYFTTKGSMAEPSMGLGLSISKSLVDSMGGRIIVEAPSGQGSRFTVELPVGDPTIGQMARADRSELEYAKLPVQQASAQGN
jgi:signal transduction histidine kinase